MQFIGSMSCSFFHFVHCIPRVYVIPRVGGEIGMQHVGSMLLCQLSIVGHCCPLYPQGLCYPHCWVLQAPKSLLQETIDPDTSPGSVLFLLAMLLHRYYKFLLRSMLVSKTRLKLHATCGVYVMPVFHCCSWYPQGLCYPHFLTCRFFLHVFTRKDRPWISKFVHRGLRLNVGLM